MDIWNLLGFVLVAVLSGTVTAGIAVTIGGVGGLSAVVRRLNLLEHKVNDTDERITSEVKKRASLKGVEAKAAQKSAEEIAALYQEENPAATGRPKVSQLIRR